MSLVDICNNVSAMVYKHQILYLFTGYITADILYRMVSCFYQQIIAFLLQKRSKVSNVPEITGKDNGFSFCLYFIGNGELFPFSSKLTR